MSIQALQARSARSEENEQGEVIDYKMVTFSLGGKDYGIDIMKVKEIAKFHDFTFVPNTPPFVRGVYNLRGDIISIIDLRLMFNLPAQQREENQPEDGLIIRLEDNMLGVVVDKIARVVGISKSRIQPPHPIFADINLKYIDGVVEHDDRLYIILDVERIFAREDHHSPEPSENSGQLPASEPESDSGSATEREGAPAQHDDVDLGFVKETLATFVDFHVTPINDQWLTGRFREWQSNRTSQGHDAQLSSPEEAEEFLAPFYSPSSQSFWSERYIHNFKSILPTESRSSFLVWNVGCGKGYESYSIAVALRQSYPEARLKIWANDKDLLSVSTAPNLVFQAESVAESFESYIVPGQNGYSFREEIRDMVVFEYHDLLHQNSIPAVDLIVARDVLSFMTPADQETAIVRFEEKSTAGTILIVGENERLPETPNWEAVDGGPDGTYRRVE